MALLLSNPFVRWAQFAFLVAALGVWGVSAYDAYELAGGSKGGILVGRRLALAFVGSLLMLFSISFVIGLSVTNSSRTTPVAGRSTDPGSGAVVEGPLQPFPFDDQGAGSGSGTDVSSSGTQGVS